ncbi:ribosome small subunit-dependent GTPase A [soil metagenome]
MPDQTSDPPADLSSEALTALGWGDRVRALFADLDVVGALPARAVPARVVPARVVRVERSSSVVATADGDRVARSEGLPAVGDWVAVELGDDDAAVVGVVPRWSELARLDPLGERVQVLAANIDVVLIMAPADRLSAARVERELVVAWESGARPVVVVTKADLVDPGSDLIEDLRRRLVNAEVVLTSSATGEGIEAIAELLRPDRTAVLLGPSGAGKSTLANALLGEQRLATADVRTGDRRGRHTTTTRQLVTVPTGGTLIDTPGLRSLGLAGGTAGVDAAFADIEELATGCRFGDCRHDQEPGCAVIAAAADGTLDRDRLASYRKLHLEQAFEARRTDVRARQEEKGRRKR